MQNLPSEGNTLTKDIKIADTTPLNGKVIIKIPKKAEQTKSGIYFDNSLASGSIEGNAQDFKHEAAQIAKEIINSREGVYMKKWGQQDKLRKIVHAEVNRLRKAKADNVYGADRFNPICAEVVAVSSEVRGIVQPGDILYFGYLKVPMLRDNKAIYEQWQFGEVPLEYGFLPLSGCYFLIRNGEITMLNDYVLVTPIEVVNKSEILHVEKESKFDSINGIVAHASAGSEVKRGDKIMMEKGCDVPLEYELVQTLPQVFFCMRESEILAKYI